MNKLELNFGALEPSIQEQLKAQGHFLLATDAEACENIRNSINTLRICGYIDDIVVANSFQKLINNIVNKLIPLKEANNLEQDE